MPVVTTSMCLALQLLQLLLAAIANNYTNFCAYALIHTDITQSSRDWCLRKHCYCAMHTSAAAAAAVYTSCITRSATTNQATNAALQVRTEVLEGVLLPWEGPLLCLNLSGVQHRLDFIRVDDACQVSVGHLLAWQCVAALDALLSVGAVDAVQLLKGSLAVQ
jgi:hypothetical protein